MKIRLGIFFGGNSTEHEISIITALQAMENLDKDKYQVVPIYLSKDSKFYVGEKISDIDKYKDIPDLIKSSTQVALVNSGNKVDLVQYPTKLFGNNVIYSIDVAFPIVHGTNVEDGTMQGLFESLSIPYVGSNVVSSAVGMDKYMTKCILKEYGISVLDGMLCYKYDFYKDSGKVINDIEDRFDYPVIVKPNNLGSSIGIELAKDSNQLLQAIENAFSYSPKILIEKAITNLKEINCAVLGDEESAISSECEQPLNAGEILSFEDKYMSSSGGKNSGGTKGGGSMEFITRKLPADIDASQRSIIKSMAVDAFKAIGCCGVARIDFMIDIDENKIYLNELNTIPGSLSFYLWKPVGIEYPDLLDKMIELGLKRSRQRKDIVYTFDTNVLSKVDIRGTKSVNKIQ